MLELDAAHGADFPHAEEDVIQDLSGRLTIERQVKITGDRYLPGDQFQGHGVGLVADQAHSVVPVGFGQRVRFGLHLLVVFRK